MSISELANSLASGSRITLTSPFLVKKVSINAIPSAVEAPKEEPGIITKGDFYSNGGTYSKLHIDKNQKIEMYDLELAENPEVGYFNKSTLNSGDMYEQCINNGFTPEEAINFVKAKRAYGMNDSFFKNGVSILSTSCCDA